MDENNASIETSQINQPTSIDSSTQQQKLNYWKVGFFIVLLLLVFSNGFLFYLLKVKNENVTKDQSRNLPAVTSTTPKPQPTSATSNSITSFRNELELLSLTKSERLNFNQTYEILWRNQDLEKWGDEILVCLVGFDSANQEITAKKEWNNEACTYRSGGVLSGSYLITTTKLSSGSYNWTIPGDLLNRYIERPVKFKIRLMVFDNLPAEGRTEWAGNVGWDESKDYLLIGNNL